MIMQDFMQISKNIDMSVTQSGNHTLTNCNKKKSMVKYGYTVIPDEYQTLAPQ